MNLFSVTDLNCTRSLLHKTHHGAVHHLKFFSEIHLELIREISFKPVRNGLGGLNSATSSATSWARSPPLEGDSTFIFTDEDDAFLTLFSDLLEQRIISR
jgi:hypothetical protein